MENTNLLKTIVQRLDKIDGRLDKIETTVNQLQTNQNKFETRFDKIEKTVNQLQTNQNNLSVDYVEVQIVDSIHDHLNKKYNDHKRLKQYVYKEQSLLNNTGNVLVKHHRLLNKYEFPKELFFANAGIEFDGVGIIYDISNSSWEELESNPSSKNIKKYLVIIESKTTLKMSRMEGVETNTKIHQKMGKIEKLKRFIQKCKELYTLIENENVMRNQISGLNTDMPLNVHFVLAVFMGKSKNQLLKKTNESIILGYLQNNYSDCKIGFLVDMR